MFLFEYQHTNIQRKKEQGERYSETKNMQIKVNKIC